MLHLVCRWMTFPYLPTLWISLVACSNLTFSLSNVKSSSGCRVQLLANMHLGSIFWQIWLKGSANIKSEADVGPQHVI